MSDKLNKNETEALNWVIAQRDPNFSDWETFTDWLEFDPDRIKIYNRVALLDADLEVLASGTANDNIAKAILPSRRGWIGGALAALLVVVAGFSYFDMGNGARYIETAAGEQRIVNLDDGSTIAINGGTHMEFEKGKTRFARLVHGEAMFDVVHIEDNPFTVESGGVRMIDIGTKFNVIRHSEGTTLAVSEGAVVYDPKNNNIRVDSGRGLEVSGDGETHIYDVASFAVGGWRTGQLVYDGTTLARIAQDIERTTGTKVTVTRNVGSLPFRGALLVDKNADRAISDLSALAGIKAEKQGNGWRLTR